MKPNRIELTIKPNYTCTWKIKKTPIKLVNIPIIPKFLSFADGGPGTNAKTNLNKVSEIQ